MGEVDRIVAHLSLILFLKLLLLSARLADGNLNVKECEAIHYLVLLAKKCVHIRCTCAAPSPGQVY